MFVLLLPSKPGTWKVLTSVFVDGQVDGIQKKNRTEYWTEDLSCLVNMATSRHPSADHDLKGAVLLQGCTRNYVEVGENSERK